jgi:RNA polymerase sigma-70 factor (ECF subfamily)
MTIPARRRYREPPQPGTTPRWIPPPDLTAAVSAARDGDEAAFRLLYRDIQPRLLRYLHPLVGSDAEDVASETWLHVARDLHTFQGDSDGFRGWVTTIARHRATDHLRQVRRRPVPAAVTSNHLGTWPASDDTELSALESVTTDAAIRLIAELPRDQAEAVLLRVVVGLDAVTAGKVLGKRPGAVRTASYRGLRKIAALLARPGCKARLAFAESLPQRWEMHETAVYDGAGDPQ